MCAVGLATVADGAAEHGEVLSRGVARLARFVVRSPQRKPRVTEARLLPRLVGCLVTDIARPREPGGFVIGRLRGVVLLLMARHTVASGRLEPAGSAVTGIAREEAMGSAERDACLREMVPVHCRPRGRSMTHLALRSEAR